MGTFHDILSLIYSTLLNENHIKKKQSSGISYAEEASSSAWRISPGVLIASWLEHLSAFHATVTVPKVCHYIGKDFYYLTDCQKATSQTKLFQVKEVVFIFFNKWMVYRLTNRKKKKKQAKYSVGAQCMYGSMFLK